MINMRGSAMVAVAAVVVGFTGTACSGGGSGGSASSSSASGDFPPATVPTLDWSECAASELDSGVDASEFRCATADVPRDYADPSGTTLQLALVQHPATDPDNRIGTLFFNPGGPGGTGTGQFTQWIGYFPTEVTDRFDVVSWDPRGVGASTAVQCFDNPDEEGAVLGAVDGFPVTVEQQQVFMAAHEEAAKRCGERAGDLLPYVSTADTARDLDLLRRAVGDEELSYWGVSYGTYLGATYANLFPDTVRAMVLDGNIDPAAWAPDGPTAESISTRIGSDAAASHAVDMFLDQCGEAALDTCAFSAGTPGATAAKWQTLLDRLDRSPVTVGSGADAETITYPTLVAQLTDAMDLAFPSSVNPGWVGTAASLQRVWVLTEQRASTPSAPEPADATGVSIATYAGPEQAWSIVCGEAASPSPDAWPGLAEEAQQRAGDSGLDLVWSDYVCSHWPARAAHPYTGPWNAATSASVLVVNNTDDPSTPLQNGQFMAQRLANAQLLTVEGVGHTALLNPSTCAYDAISAYLADPTDLPATDALCGQDATPFG